MDLNNLKCVSLSDGLMDDDDDAVHVHRPFSKNHTGGNGLSTAGSSPAASVNELLECPVCTNSMYPPIHQAAAGLGWWCRCSFVGLMIKKKIDEEKEKRKNLRRTQENK